MITTKSEQQNHNKFVYSHGSVCCGFKGSLHQGVTMELKFTRRRVTEETQETVQSRKVLHFNQISATHHWKEMWIARLVFPLAFTSTDHTVI